MGPPLPPFQVEVGEQSSAVLFPFSPSFFFLPLFNAFPQYKRGGRREVEEESKKENDNDDEDDDDD